MAVNFICGMTESGKTYRANEEAKKYRKRISFDPARCLKDGVIYDNPSNKQISEIYKKHAHLDSFSIIIRPGGKVERKFWLDKVIKLARSLGERVGTYENQKKGLDRIVVLIDEIDKCCTPTQQSPDLQWLINEGRHYSLDTIAISRLPQRVHTDITGNSSKLICFNLQTDVALRVFYGLVGSDGVSKIRSLKQYHYFEFKDTGEWAVFDDKGRKSK